MKEEQIAMAVWQAADIIESAPEYWLQYVFARKPNGSLTSVDDRHACQFCPSGMVAALLGTKDREVGRDFVIEYAHGGLYMVNDTKGRIAAIKLMRKACLNWEQKQNA